MAPNAADDDIADWYEQEFLGGQSTGARTRDGSLCIACAGVIARTCR